MNSMLKKAANSATGKIAKACIEISDTRSKNVDPVMKPALKSADSLAASFDSSFMDEMRGRMGFTDGISSVRKKFQDDGSVRYSTMRISDPRWNSVRRFTVQFNPDTLSFTANSGDHIGVMNIADGKRKISTENNLTSALYMSVQLIFDAVDNQDAFTDDKLSANPENLARTAVNGVYNMAGGGREVRTEVEGFIGALNNPETRTIRFIWGNLLYKGSLSHVNAEYTMFAPDGRPIRAKVDLRIICDMSTVEYDKEAGWDQQYANAFLTQRNLMAASSFMEQHQNVSKKIGSLINW